MAAKSEYFTKAGDWLTEFNNYCNEAKVGDIVVATNTNGQYIFEVEEIRYAYAKDKMGVEKPPIVAEKVIPVCGSVCKVEKVRVDDKEIFPRYTTKYTPIDRVKDDVYIEQVTCLKTDVPSNCRHWLDDSDVKNRIGRYKQILQQYSEAVGV